MHAVKRKLLLGVAISGLFLYLSTRGIDWGAFRAALARVRLEFLVPGIVCTMLGHFSRSVRWKFMMTPIKACRIAPLWSATAIAFMVNNLLPARLGEFVRAIAIGRTDGLTKWLIDPSTDRVLGCGIVGTGAGELIAEAVVAIEMGCTARDVADSIHPHPTLSETLSFAAEVYLGTATEVYRPKRK